MKKFRKKTYRKRHHTKSKFRSKSKNTRKTGGKVANYKPIPLPEVPSLIDNTIQDIMDETANMIPYGGKPKSKKRHYRGGFKTDSVDEIEDRDDDWIRSKQ